MNVTAIKTRAMVPPKDDIFPVFDEHLPKLASRDILLITSKVLAIHQGRCVPVGSIPKDELVKREADLFLSKGSKSGGSLTLKGATMLSSAGIDESNGNGHYILWPEHPSESARDIRRHLMEKHGTRELGVIVVDSHSVPLRGGSLGTAIGFWGIEPLRYHCGRHDLFKRRIKGARSNVPDALAAVGTLAMGEVDEQTPLCLIRGADMVHFTDEDRRDGFFLRPDEDYYAFMYETFKKP